MKEDKKSLTSESGRKIEDNENISSAGKMGPALL